MLGMKGRERPGLMTCSVLAKDSGTDSVLALTLKVLGLGYGPLEAYCVGR